MLYLFRLSALLLFGLLLSSCSSPKDPIKIGVVLPLSGPFQVYGEQGLNGARLAVEKINSEGGVLGGHPLELVVRNNETDPALSVKYSRELIQLDGVFALLGPVSSAARYAMVDIAEQFKVPMMYGIDYEGRHYSPFLVCYSTIPEHYVDPLIPYLIEQSGKGFYIFGYDYIWPHRMSERIIAEVDRHKGRIAGREFTPFGVADYTAVFERIKASDADNLMLILPGSDGFRFIEQMSQFKFNRPIRTVAFAADETYLDQVSHNALEGKLTALHFFSDWKDPAFTDFVESYQRRFGTDAPVTYSSKAHYDLVHLLKMAIEKSGTLEKVAVAQALSNLKLYNNGAQVTLRDDHHFNLPMFLAEYKGGKLGVIQSLGTIAPDDQRKNPADAVSAQ